LLAGIFCPVSRYNDAALNGFYQRLGKAGIASFPVGQSESDCGRYIFNNKILPSTRSFPDNRSAGMGALPHDRSALYFGMARILGFD
jgi:hypothetical protein